jgi:hypothetical protein
VLHASIPRSVPAARPAGSHLAGCGSVANRAAAGSVGTARLE